MKTRKEAARLIERQMYDIKYKKPIKTCAYHYGYQELKELLDFIWERKPTEVECILTDLEYKRRSK